MVQFLLGNTIDESLETAAMIIPIMAASERAGLKYSATVMKKDSHDISLARFFITVMIVERYCLLFTSQKLLQKNVEMTA